MNQPPHTSEPADCLRALATHVEQAKLQSDSELLELFVESGNRQSIETLIRRYSSMVASVCRCTVADPASAEDAFQATFLVLLKSAKKIQRRGSVAAWLHGVAYRTASRLRKKRLLNVSHESPDELIAHNPTETDPIVTLARQMELEALDQELQKLPVRLRDVLVEHYLLGYSAPQIADRMELSVSAVEGRIRRGRHALRHVLARRGISLSVLVVASTWFQQHVQASAASNWTSTFLDAYLPNGAPAHDFSISSDISSLVSGELGMFGATTSKGLLAVVVMLLIGGLISFRAIGVESGEPGDDALGTASVLDLKTLPEELPQVVAQVAIAPAVQSAVPAGIPSMGPAAQPIVNNGAIEVANKSALPPAKPEPIVWTSPELNPPTWLDASTNAEAAEKVRASLNLETDVDYDGQPLLQVVESLSDVLGVEIYLDEAELQNAGVKIDQTITLRTHSSVREVLRRMMMQIEDTELGYIVRESGIEITTVEAVDADLHTRYYDLSYVLPNSENAESVMRAISQQIQPDKWSEAGGTWAMSLVGSMLIVSCPDPAHFRIESMLSKLAAMNRANLEKQVLPGGGYGGMGGMGGMGGYGGGMGGGGGFGGGMGGGGMF